MSQSIVRSAVLAAIGFALSSPAAIAGGYDGSTKDEPATSYRWDGVYIGGGAGGSWAKDRMRPGCANTFNIRSYDDGADGEYSDLCQALNADGRTGVIADEQDDRADPLDGDYPPNATPHNGRSVNYLPVDGDSEYFAPIREDVRDAQEGWLGGGQIGLNKQYGRFVIGAELGAYKFSRVDSGYRNVFDYFDDDEGNFDDADGVQGYLNEYLGTGTVSGSSKVDWLGKATMRLGTTIGEDQRVLAYVVGGAAVAKVSTSLNGSFDGTNANDGDCDNGQNDVPCSFFGNSSGDMYQFGGLIGAGAEFALGHGLSIGVEYNYIKLSGAKDLTATFLGDDNDAGGATAEWSYRYRAGFDDLHSVMMKMNLRFE